LKSCSCQVLRGPSNGCRGSSHLAMESCLKAGSIVRILRREALALTYVLHILHANGVEVDSLLGHGMLTYVYN